MKKSSNQSAQSLTKASPSASTPPPKTVSAKAPVASPASASSASSQKVSDVDGDEACATWLDIRYKQMPSEEGTYPSLFCSVYKKSLTHTEAFQKLRKILLDQTVWSSEWQANNNATTIARAFHDDLGVKSIPIVFCDDILSGKVVRLPLWHTWKDLLNPIFEAAGLGSDETSVKRNKIIRCLFANLPAGKDIPVHHDTGYWAMNSHRVHVPIITSSQTDAKNAEVEFYSGQTNETLKRCPFAEGSVVELNNRAKHMVKNNWNQRRVHMIFDFVEDDVASRLTFVDIKPGMEIKQTRRTLMISADGGVDNDDNASVDSSMSGMSDATIIADPEEIGKKTKEIISFLEKISEGDRFLSALRIDTFYHVCKCYGKGELPEYQFIQQLISSVGKDNLQILIENYELHRLFSDEERRHSLIRLYESFKSTGKITQVRPGISADHLRNTLKTKVYFLIGAMKSGTTSLHSYIHQHPSSLPGHRQKEPHTLDWKWTKFCSLELTNQQNKAMIESGFVEDGDMSPSFYLRAKFAMSTININAIKQESAKGLSNYFIGDATPSYILGGSVVARRAYAISPEARIIVILRDPVARALSQYAMMADKDCTPEQRKRRGNVDGKAFEDVVKDDMTLLKQAKIHPGSIFQHFESRYSAKSPYGHGGHSFIGRGLYALQLEGWLDAFPAEQFCVMFLEDITVEKSSDGNNDTAIKHINEAMEPIWKHLGVEENSKECVKEFERKNVSKVKVTMTPEMETTLRSYYQPHNERLQRVLANISQNGGYVSPKGMKYVESWCAGGKN